MKMCHLLGFKLNSNLEMGGCDWHFGLKTTTHSSCYARLTSLFLLIIPLANAKPQSFNFPYFSPMNVNLKQLQLDGNASNSGSSIQLTMDGVGPNSNGIGQIGRVRYPEFIHLWDNSTGEQMDFTTNFSFVISSNQSSYGDGMTFFLASPNLLKEEYSVKQTGGGLGLALADGDESLLGTGPNQFVAVEFDTFPNEWDPDGAHVGLNVNSMQSDILEEWNTDIPNERVYDCSIEYSSKNNYLNVSFTGYRFNGEPVTQYLAYHINITEHLPKLVVVGMSAATGGSSENHTILSWSFSTSQPRISHHKKEIKLMNPKLLEGIGIGIGFPLSLVGLVHILLWKMKNGKEEEPTSETASDLNMDYEFRMSTGPKKIHYYDLLTATNNFDEKQKLGQGGFGGVYKGYLKDSNSYAAIKRISADSKQGIKQYEAEVKIISQLRHRNLVKLTGWCHKKNDLILIYEYMPNGSLDSHLFRGESMLSWQVRYNIALGLASALLYLQEEWEKCVLHRDIKSSNIMLDSNFNAKLGDFGLARLMDHEKVSETTVVAGTMGYLAPEYMNTGKARKESDIFSFGVVLLEIASGRKSIHYQDMEGQVSLVEWVWELYGMRNLLAAADPKLCGVFDVQQTESLLVVGLWCANPDSISRPCIRQVIKVLNFEAPLPILPKHVPKLDLHPPTTNDCFYSVPSFFWATG